MTDQERLSEQARRGAAVLMLAADALLIGDVTDVESATTYASRIARSVDEDPLWANGEHCGDCTKQPHTCQRCLLDEYEDAATALFDSDDDLPSLARQLTEAERENARLRQEWRRAFGDALTPCEEAEQLSERYREALVRVRMWLDPVALGEDEDTALTEARRFAAEALDTTTAQAVVSESTPKSGSGEEAGGE